MKQGLFKVCSALSAALLLQGCSPTPVDTLQLAPSEWIYQGYKQGDQWQLAAVDEALTLSIDGQRISGDTACNSFFTQYQQTADRFTVAAPATTRMLCADTQMQAEQQLLERLTATVRVSRDEQMLYLHQADGSALVYRRYEPIDQGGLFSYQVCEGHPDGLLIGADNSQCVLSGEVFFADQRPPISLTYCSSYDDGCNRYQVADAQLGAATLMACPEQLSEPTCYIGDGVYGQLRGQVIDLGPGWIDILAGDIAERYTVPTAAEKGIALAGFEIGDSVQIEYNRQSNQTWLLSIMPD